MSRKKTHGEVIGAELQEGLTHIGNAVAEASRAAAEQLGPRVEAAQKAAGPALEAAQKTVEAKVAPKVAVAVATAAPAVATAREALAPRVEAAQKAAGPALEAAREAVQTRVVPVVVTARESLAPRVEAALETTGPKVTAAVAAAQAAAEKAAADLAPRIEAAGRAAQQALNDDVVPRLGAAQTAALAYAAPRVAAARQAVTPVLETARGELVLTAADLRKRSAKQRRKLEKKAARTTATVKRKVGAEPTPTRWPWYLAAAAAIAAAVFVLLRRKKSDDDLWPAPAGDGPVPTYREDPVPSSPSDSGKTVSSAQTAPNDATPPDSDLGMWAQQQANPEVTDDDVPGSATSGAATDAVNTSINTPAGGVSEGPGGVSPTTDATNDTDADTGPAGTPLADRGVEPEGGPNPA